jgi:hypothetical protein
MQLIDYAISENFSFVLDHHHLQRHQHGCHSRQPQITQKWLLTIGTPAGKPPSQAGALRYIDKSLPSLQLLPLYSFLVILGLLLRTSSFIAIRKKMRPCPSEAVVLPHDGLMNGLCATLGHFLFYSTPQY